MSIKKIIYAGLAFIAIGFAACTQNEDMAPSLSGQAINATFSVGGVQTRVNTLGDGNCWEVGDSIYVCNYDKGQTGIYTYAIEDDVAHWNSDNFLRWNNTSACTLIAVCNPSLKNNLNRFELNLVRDQSTESKLKMADYMSGCWYGKPELLVEIPMKHRMSRITISYEIGTYDFPSMDINSMQICSPCSGASFSLSNNDWEMNTSAYKESMWVDACKIQNGEDKSFSAIIVPGSFDTSVDFLKFTLDGKNYTVKLKQRTEFLEGHRYIYSLRKIGRDEIELDVYNQGVLPGWENEDELK